MTGQTLSHYRILDKLGAGGIGEVYLAGDTTLKRQVALEVLPAELSSDPDRLERSEREAKTLGLSLSCLLRLMHDPSVRSRPWV